MAIFDVVGTRRVLVVDDDPDIRELLVSVLSDDGYDTRSATDGRDALAKIEHWRPDVVVLDLMMPVMDGWTFAARLREKGPAIPIVILSAVPDVSRVAVRLDAAGVVPKPFDIETLLPAIARVAGGGTARV